MEKRKHKQAGDIRDNKRLQGQRRRRGACEGLTPHSALSPAGNTARRDLPLHGPEGQRGRQRAHPGVFYSKMNLFVGQECGRRRPSSRGPLALPPPRSPQVTPAGGGEAGRAAVPLNSIPWFTSPPSPCNNYSRAVAPPPAPRGLPAWAPPISARPRHSEGNETRRKGKKKFGEERAGPAGAAGPAQVRERGGAGAAGPGLRQRPRTATGRGDGGRPPHWPRGAAEGLCGGFPLRAPDPRRQRARGCGATAGAGPAGSFSAFFGGSVLVSPPPAGGCVRRSHPGAEVFVLVSLGGRERQSRPSASAAPAGPGPAPSARPAGSSAGPKPCPPQGSPSPERAPLPLG
ncbi:translation initiation factor IF-2-like [Pyrgilauda ruficollis]|uniref:translation initiation factor IF-2-like n=1 Tax=Pyrgilauda ruficollis TaxID=221976 RepID=UPI001B873442|nr:translation initiation factor IF-2-like [Pyrgilauda ruficollis]